MGTNRDFPAFAASCAAPYVAACAPRVWGYLMVNMRIDGQSGRVYCTTHGFSGPFRRVPTYHEAHIQSNVGAGYCVRCVEFVLCRKCRPLRAGGVFHGRPGGTHCVHLLSDPHLFWCKAARISYRPPGTTTCSEKLPVSAFNYRLGTTSSSVLESVQRT